MRTSLALVMIAACGGGGTRALDECPGDRPTIADCYVGEFFADCGGTGDEPVLGCDDQGSCLWFTGGCAPEGFDGSTCASDNVCCHDDWPFEGEHNNGLGPQLIEFGTVAWDRTTATAIAVTIDPTLTEAMTTIACTGSDPHATGMNACNTTLGDVVVAQRGTTVFEVGPAPGLVGVAGWSLWIEILDDGTGTTRARACEAEYSDLPDVCFPHQARCATAGTVTTNQLPVVDNRQLVVDVDVTFANGFHVVATLVGAL